MRGMHIPLKQVRNGAFEQQLHERLESAEQDKRNAVELAQTNLACEMYKSAVALGLELQELNARLYATQVVCRLTLRSHGCHAQTQA